MGYQHVYVAIHAELMGDRQHVSEIYFIRGPRLLGTDYGGPPLTHPLSQETAELSADPELKEQLFYPDAPQAGALGSCCKTCKGGAAGNWRGKHMP